MGSRPRYRVGHKATTSGRADVTRRPLAVAIIEDVNFQYAQKHRAPPQCMWDHHQEIRDPPSLSQSAKPEHGFVCTIVDIHLPGMSGFELRGVLDNHGAGLTSRMLHHRHRRRHAPELGRRKRLRGLSAQAVCPRAGDRGRRVDAWSRGPSCAAMARQVPQRTISLRHFIADT